MSDAAAAGEREASIAPEEGGARAAVDESDSGLYSSAGMAPQGSPTLPLCLVSLERELQCGICLDILVLPSVLPNCGHTFCCGCIRGLLRPHDIAGLLGMWRVKSCPICREPIPKSIPTPLVVCHALCLAVELLASSLPPLRAGELRARIAAAAAQYKKWKEEMRTRQLCALHPSWASLGLRPLPDFHDYDQWRQDADEAALREYLDTESDHGPAGDADESDDTDGTSRESTVPLLLPPGMTNEQLAHELLLDKDFRLDEKAGMSDDKLVHTKIRETFERAFWESLVEDLSTLPPTYARVLSVLSEIKTGIQSLTEGHPEKERIGAVIDMDKITEQLRQDKLTFVACENLINDIVGVLLSMHERMRSPERRKETVSNWEAVRSKMQEAASLDQEARARATCGALELVLDRVHAVRVDTANNKLKAIAPVIREHGVEYEKSHFVKKLEKNLITLDRTKLWVTHTLCDIVLTSDPRVVVADLPKGKPEDFEVVLYIAMVNLIADYPNWGGLQRGASEEDLVPETMMLDLLRIKALNMHFHTDVVSSVILVTAEAQCLLNIKDASLRSDLFKAVQDVVVKNPPKPNNPRVTIRLAMNVLQRGMTQTMLDACQNLMEKNVKKSSAVHNAMTKIFKRVWYHLVKDKTVPATCNVPECAKPLLVEVAKHTGSLAAVALHNKKVHVTRYNDIIKTAGDAINKQPPAAAARPGADPAKQEAASAMAGKKRASPEGDDTKSNEESLAKKRMMTDSAAAGSSSKS